MQVDAKRQIISYLEMFLKKNILLIFRGDHALGNYEHNTPHTWKEVLLTDISIPQAVGKIWQPILPYFQDSVKIIEQIATIGLVASPSQPSPIGLIYIFQHIKSDEMFSWLGCEPVDPDQLFQFQERFGFPLPASYQKFCSVHNGLLRDGWNSSGPRPIEKLRLLEFDQDTDTQKHRLLAFSGDGAGNEQCYHLHLPVDSNDYLTVDWDHESEQIGRPHTFWTYLEALLKSEMGIPDR
jgi:SMI1 / KNR4 family (SUKH-1)